MTQILRAAAIAALVAIASSPAAAARFRVDDSGTVVNPPVAKMERRELIPRRGSENVLEGRLTVALRLNLATWLNRSARIYMLLAPTDGTPLTATWRTQGRLLPGSLHGGGRALVFDGVVRDAFLNETLVIDLVTSSRSLTPARTQSLQFNFEIEVLP